MTHHARPPLGLLGVGLLPIFLGCWIGLHGQSYLSTGGPESCGSAWFPNAVDYHCQQLLGSQGTAGAVVAIVGAVIILGLIVINVAQRSRRQP